MTRGGELVAQLEVWQASARGWQWRYTEHAPSPISLESHKEYEGREAAEHAARVAYPGVPFVARTPGHRRPDWFGVTVLGAVAVYALARGAGAGGR